MSNCQHTHCTSMSVSLIKQAQVWVIVTWCDKTRWHFWPPADSGGSEGSRLSTCNGWGTSLWFAKACVNMPDLIFFITHLDFALAYSKHCVYRLGGARRSGFFWPLVISENTQVQGIPTHYQQSSGVFFCGTQSHLLSTQLPLRFPNVQSIYGGWDYVWRHSE